MEIALEPLGLICQGGWSLSTVLNKPHKAFGIQTLSFSHTIFNL